MTPIQQLFLGIPSGSKTYIEDVFSTYLYDGQSNTATPIQNGLDLAGEGGMVWIKCRSNQVNHNLYDTERGVNRPIETNSVNAAQTSGPNIGSFDSDGFTHASSDGLDVNETGRTFSSWSFRKAPGFFDVVTWTGDGNNRTISHSLGSVPGMIVIKCTSTTKAWQIGHRGMKDTDPWNWSIPMSTSGPAEEAGAWNNTAPTSSVFSISTNHTCNLTGETYVAYVFAGGESTAATACSVNFDGVGDKLSIADHTDLEIGSSTYTMEFWVYKNADTPDDYDVWAAKGSNNNATREFAIESMTTQKIHWYYSTGGSTWSNVVVSDAIPTGQWTHICAQKDSSGYFSFFVNGIRTYYSTTGAEDLYTGSGEFCIAGFEDSNNQLESNIKISNFRFVKGTALYSSSFKPSTEPLTDVTNTKLLCCQSSTITAATVTPGTITTTGDPAASIDSPFDDLDGYKFGAGGDQNIIECGSYVGNGSNDGPPVEVGFEPQWLMIKHMGGNHWEMYDTMRGISTDGNDSYLEPDDTAAEWNGADYISLTPTGFVIDTNSSHINGSGERYIYLAIRRPDGYVGTPASVGTDVFALSVGTTNSDIPTFTSGHVTDFTLFKQFAGTDPWYSQARITGLGYMLPASDAAEGDSADNTWDFMNGYYKATGDWSAFMNWMWKRGAGFDVVTYEGNQFNGRSIPHNLAQPPEMIWIKNRDSTSDWIVGHKGINAGTDPWDYVLKLNTNAAQQDYPFFDDFTPTSTYFKTHNNSAVNWTDNYMAMLFSSVEGISKCGYYTGTGAAGNTQTTGFTPRFILVKCVSDTVDWGLFDSVRGLGSSGDDQRLYLNTDAAQVGGYDYLTTSATGFTPAFVGSSVVNASGQNFIYYAHA